MFEVLVDAEKKSAVAQKDRPKLFDQREEFVRSQKEWHPDVTNRLERTPGLPSGTFGDLVAPNEGTTPKDLAQTA
jgi:hypothetical protein